MVTRLGETTGDWRFKVVVAERVATNHQVTVSKDDWRRLTKEQITPEELVKASFEFLLEREPKESILASFDLSVIRGYFPEYDEAIKKRALG